MSIHLLGGGRGDDVAELLRPFTAEVGQGAKIAMALIDEGSAADDIARFSGLLSQAGDCVPVPVVVPIGQQLDPDVLGDVDGLFVCGGLTPAYAAAVGPAATAIRSWVAAGHSYGGFSAGSAIAADRAVVGGWSLDGVPICHEDSGEDLDELSVVDGLGLISIAIDVHCAQWGTLSRLVAAVESGAVSAGAGIDESTMLTVSNSRAKVTGRGSVWLVTRSAGGALVRALRDGDGIDLAQLAS